MKQTTSFLIFFFTLIPFFLSPIVFSPQVFAQTPSWTKNPSFSEGIVTAMTETETALFVGTSDANANKGGIYRSHDDGKSWQAVGLLGIEVKAMMVSNSIVFAAITETTSSHLSGIYRSLDGGDTWEHVGPHGGYISFTKQGNTLYAGSSSGTGVWQSTDNGATWTQLGLMGFEVYFLAANSSALYALVRSNLTISDGFYRSTNSGFSWNRMAVSSAPGGLHADEQVVLAAMDTILLRSTDNGNSFQGVVNVPNIGNGGLGPITSDGSNYYMGNWRPFNVMIGGIIKSSNRGATWQAINTGLDYTARTSVNITLLFASAKHKKLYSSAWSQGLWEYPVDLTPSLPPVIIIPGLSGTQMIHKDTGEVRWVDSKQLIFSKTDDFLDVLSLGNDGKTSLDGNWIAGKVVDVLDMPDPLNDIDFYLSLKKSLISLGYEEHENLFLFGYDWRRDVSNNGWPGGMNTTLDRLDALVTGIGKKPIIISHSLGGLVVAQYINNQQRAQKVAQVVTLGTPWNGVPKTFVLLHYGYSEVPGMNRDKAKELAENFPSVYEILPTQAFFSHYSSYFIDDTDRDGDGITGPLTFAQSQSLIRKMHNPSAQDIATAFYNQGIGDWSRGTNNVPVYTVVGTGIGTPGVIHEWYEKNLFGDKTRKQSYTCINGDGTVPFHSANVSNPSSLHKVYYANNIDHGQLPNDAHVQGFIKSILLGSPIQEDSVITNQATATFTGTCLKVFSPVSLHIYDQEGRHNGPVNDNGDTQVEIPGSSYDILDESKIAILPKGNYRVELNALATGSFDLAVEKITNGQTEQTTFFNDIPIASTSAKASLSVNNQTPSNLALDTDGDSNQSFTATTTVSGNQTLDIVPPKTTVNLAGQLGNNNWYVSSVSATLTASDSGSGVLETRYRLGEEQLMLYHKPLLFSNDGIATISAQSIDKLGNTEEPITTFIAIDQTKPRITLISPFTQDFLQGDSVTFLYQATDALSGLASTSASFANQAVSNNQTVKLTNLGKQIFLITAQDQAGNQASQSALLNVRFPVKVEFIPPELHLSSKGKYITLLVTVPDPYSSDEVDIPTVAIYGTIPTISKVNQVKKINPYKKSLRLDFDSKTLIDYLKKTNPINKDKLTLTITGQLTNGIGFQGKVGVVVKIP